MKFINVSILVYFCLLSTSVPLTFALTYILNQQCIHISFLLFVINPTAADIRFNKFLGEPPLLFRTFQNKYKIDRHLITA